MAQQPQQPQQQQRISLWTTEPDLDEDVDLSLAIGNYGQNAMYEDGTGAHTFSL